MHHIAQSFLSLPVIRTPSIRSSICAFIGTMAVSACGGVAVEDAEPYVTEQSERLRQEAGTIHGNDKGFVLFSTRDSQDEAPSSSTDDVETAARPGPSGGGLAVANPFLWQASLESLDFMPLAQADSRGGVIISDWYAPPETPDERFKVTVYILDPTLRADALKVSVFRQTKNESSWVDAEVDKATAAGLEENILTRARELRLANGSSS